MADAATKTAGSVAADWPAPAFRTIRTGRLVLRTMTLDDAPDVFPVLSDPGSMRHWYHLPHRTLDETVALLRDRRLVDDGTSRIWAITTDGGRWQGDICLFRMPRSAPGLLWLGYILAPAARGKGYAVEAGRAVLEYAFRDWGAHRVEANLDPENAGSIAVLDRLGFRHEGTQRRNFLLGTAWKDTGIYGLLADEWRARTEREAA